MRVNNASDDNDDQNGNDIKGIDADLKVRNRLHSLNKDDKDEELIKQLKTKDGLFLDTYIESRLKPTRKSICEGMVFAMERPQYSKAITAKISDAVKDICRGRNDPGDDLAKVKTLLYLTSDILFNSVASTEAWSFVRHFEASMPHLMLHINCKLLSGAYGKLSRKKLVKAVKRVFQLWNDKSIYNDSLTTGWMATLKVERDSYLTFKSELDLDSHD